MDNIIIFEPQQIQYKYDALWRSVGEVFNMTLLHKHNYLELIYVINGSSLQEINGHKYVIDPGEVMLIDADMTHAFAGNPSANFVCVSFCPSYLAREEDGTVAENFNGLKNLGFIKGRFASLEYTAEPIKLSPASAKLCKQLFKALAREKRNLHERKVTPETDEYTKSMLMTIVIEYMRALKNKLKNGLKNGDIISDDLIEYMLALPPESLVLEELAKKQNCNPSYFSRKFKKVMGETFTDYVIRLKLERAADLLVISNLAIDEICEAVGYTYITGFYKNFKKQFGMTPAKYRETQPKSKIL